MAIIVRVCLFFFPLFSYTSHKHPSLSEALQERVSEKNKKPKQKQKQNPISVLQTGLPPA